MAEHESALAVLVDFENMARPGAKGRGDFDIHLVLDRLAEKGRVLVKRAYADWSRYRDARHELQNAGLGLIEMPSAREGAKNRADIQMAVDAMELAYSREHVGSFVIVSGDSDFTPLVGKLRELNKRVIGVGNRESASELLIANCDEFIFYDRLAAEAGGAGTRQSRAASSGLNPTQLLQETLTALQREGVEWPLASVVKDSMRRKYPAFDESEHGYSTFSKFLEDAGTNGIVRLETDPRSGTYRVELAGTATPAPPVPTSAPAGDRAAEGGEGEGRRRRRRRRSEQGAEAAPPATEDAEVFEIVVTPTPDPDLGALPPIGEPISYEDMIMLGPEGDDVPELAEATDLGAEEPPSRSSRRRRRRAAVADPEPTVADLEPIDPAELEPAAEAAEAEPAAEQAHEEPAAEAAAPASRRRRRRRADETTADEAPAADAAAVEAVAEPAEEPAAAETAAPEAEEAPAPSRRRVRRRAPAQEEPAAPSGEEQTEAAVAAEEPPAEEAPKPKRRTRKKAEPVAAEPEAAEQAPAEEPAAEAPAEEEAPKPKRRTRKKAEPVAAEAEGEAAAAAAEAPAEEAPKPRRRTTRKKAEPAGDAEAPAAAPEEAVAEEAPKPKRRTRKKAEPAPEPEAAATE
ncbi:MAG: NYN domain-containing protein [Thermoleophilia bacterium]